MDYESYGCPILFCIYSPLNKSPDTLTTDDLKRYFTQLIKTHSWSTVRIDRNGLQFFFKHVLQRGWER
ncbi:phage integrase N-terminal SAM-like domain-containing protein [Photobacterium carnosum]|uniref:phage integrase N-terminal SAM-like domain-containing protein n=1 Tax=Photobacterium carnosum TaxID=2023717 RepID=UPI0039F65289